MSVACGTQATLLRAWTTSTPWLSFGLMQSHISTVKTSFLNSTWSLACLVRAWVSNLNKEIKVLNWGIRTDQQDDCPPKHSLSGRQEVSSCLPQTLCNLNQHVLWIQSVRYWMSYRKCEIPLLFLCLFSLVFAKSTNASTNPVAATSTLFVPPHSLDKCPLRGLVHPQQDNSS